MGIRIVTPPAVEPIGLMEAKDHLRVSHDADDALIDGLIQSVRIAAEDFTWRALITRTLDWTVDHFGQLARGVPQGKLQSVTSISYVDTAGVLQVLDPADYQVDTASEPGRIAPAYGTCWPATRAEFNAVTVRLVAGYGPTGAAVPGPITDGMKLMLTDRYENRQSEAVGAVIGRFSQTAHALWQPYRVFA